MRGLKFGLMYSVVLSIALLSWDVSAKEVPYTLEDRDRLIRIETSLKEFKDSVDKRFEQIMNFMWMLSAIFVGVTGATIGFAIWDRRSMIRPFEAKVREIEESLELERGKVESLIHSLRELAKTDEDVSAVLKRFNLL